MGIKLKNRKTNAIKEVDKVMASMMIGTGEWEEAKEKKVISSSLGESKNETR